MESFEIKREFVFTIEDAETHLNRTLSVTEWEAVSDWMCDGFEAYLESDLSNLSNFDFTKLVEDWKQKNIV